MDDKKQIEEIEREANQLKELAKIIRFVLENRTDIQYIPDLAFPIAKELLKHYQPKLPENAVALTREEYEKTIQDYQDLLENFDNYLFEYRKFADGCIKDARKETAKEILDKVDKESNGQILSITNLLRKQYGV